MKQNKWLAPVTAVALLGVFLGSMGSQVVAANAGPTVTRVSEVPIPEVPAQVKTARENGVITAEEWSTYYPEVYASHMANADNNPQPRVAYPEQDPNIQVLYQGMAFSFDYTEAIGHSYTLEDIAETTRPHKLANCLTCKTADYTALVNKLGTEAYSLPFEDVVQQMSETVSCYNCHGNTPGTIVIESDYMANAMGDEMTAGTVDAINVSCAQCHIEYYFDPATKATSVPYDSPDNFDPDSILAYYNEMGFVDFTNENTGVGMIKVQHPEFETYTGAGSVHSGTFNCADCHMGVDYTKKGTPFVSHEFTSPLDNEALVQSNCAQCHANLKADVEKIQKEITEKETQVSDLLVELNSKLADAVASGSLSEAELAKLRQLDRDAQFYWDFVYVENSEGAHNSKLSRECLGKAETLAKEALALL